MTFNDSVLNEFEKLKVKKPTEVKGQILHALESIKSKKSKKSIKSIKSSDYNESNESKTYGNVVNHHSSGSTTINSSQGNLETSPDSSKLFSLGPMRLIILHLLALLLGKRQMEENIW